MGVKSGRKAALALLVLALIAALTLGQKGLEAREKRESGLSQQDGEKKAEMTRKDKNTEAYGEKTAQEERRQRVQREGKVLQESSEAVCVVLDPGHGGYDPGKIGINQALEKDVNLAVALLLREYLEAAGVKTVMTRQEDLSLGETGEENKKVRDLKKRIEIIEQSAPVLAVSIHQNSYPEEYVSGAQVFYYRTSTEGQKLAKALQDRLIKDLDPANNRQIKENDSYYLLKKTSVPLVIVECGFLSNWEEAKKLCAEEYQDALAWTIYMGIMDYLETAIKKVA